MDKMNNSHLAWRKSSLCASGECVEVATDGQRVFIRDSAAPSGAPVLELIREQWGIFLRSVSVYGRDVPSPTAAPDDRRGADKSRRSPKVGDVGYNELL